MSTNLVNAPEAQRLVQHAIDEAPKLSYLEQRRWYAGIDAQGKVGAVARYVGYGCFKNSLYEDVQFVGSVYLRALSKVAK